MHPFFARPFAQKFLSRSRRAGKIELYLKARRRGDFKDERAHTFEADGQTPVRMFSIPVAAVPDALSDGRNSDGDRTSLVAFFVSRHLGEQAVNQNLLTAQLVAKQVDEEFFRLRKSWKVSGPEKRSSIRFATTI